MPLWSEEGSAMDKTPAPDRAFALLVTLVLAGLPLLIVLLGPG